MVKLLLAEENIELDMETVDFADKQTGISVPMCGGLTVHFVSKSLYSI